MLATDIRGWGTTSEVEDRLEAPPAYSGDLARFEGTRIRVHITGRKMAVPGRLAIVNDRPTLCTNWGLELDLTHQPVTRVDTKNADTGRWVAA